MCIKTACKQSQEVVETASRCLSITLCAAAADITQTLKGNMKTGTALRATCYGVFHDFSSVSGSGENRPVIILIQDGYYQEV